jgi:mannose-6-phosphate isomerase
VHALLRLRGAIQRYDWGSRTALAELQGRPAPSETPEAELWLGAHPKGPAEVDVDGRWEPLDRALGWAGEAWLGAAVVQAFGPRLPFLLKVLAVERPLSIQAHPDAVQARAGFERERADPPGERRYADPYPKPELVCALTPFRALCGFRPVEEVRARLAPLGLEALLGDSGDAEEARLARLYRGWLESDPEDRRRGLARAVEGARREAARDRASAWLLRLAEVYPADPGLLAPLLLHDVELAPGEALFLAPGTLHCHLAGTAVEIMASSDNVLRGGLTSKAVHLDELLRVTRFESRPPSVLAGEERAPGERVYRTEAAEFELSRLEPSAGAAVAIAARRGIEILLCERGPVRVAADGASLALGRGESCLVPAAAGPYRVEGSGRVFRAAIPSGLAAEPTKSEQGVEETRCAS